MCLLVVFRFVALLFGCLLLSCGCFRCLRVWCEWFLVDTCCFVITVNSVVIRYFYVFDL